MDGLLPPSRMADCISRAISSADLPLDRSFGIAHPQNVDAAELEMLPPLTAVPKSPFV
jgi:hypothetical protein